MEFRGTDFVKKVQIKQEAEELKHRLEELEYESKIKDNYDDYKNYQQPSQDFEQIDLQDLALSEAPEKHKIDKKKYAFLILFLSIVFIFTVIVIKFFMSYINQDDDLNANKVDEKQIEQKFEQIVAQTKDVNSTEQNGTHEVNTTSVNPQVIEKTIKPNQIQETPITTTPVQKVEPKKEVIVKETKIEVRQIMPKPKPTEQKIPDRNLKELFGNIETKQKITKTESLDENAKFIQVGSFSKDPDEKLFSQLNASGYKYKVIESEKNGKKVTKVIVGPIKAENASNELSKIKNNIAPSAFITK